MTRVGVGLSTNRHPTQAGRAAVQAAFKQAEIDACDMVLLFATATYDPRLLLPAVREASARAPLCGCTVRSLSSGKYAQDNSPAVAVIAFKSASLKWQTASTAAAPGEWQAAGTALAHAVEGTAGDARGLWIFADGLHLDWGELRAALSAARPAGAATPTLGIAAADGPAMRQTVQFNGDQILTGGVSAALMMGQGSVATAAESFSRPVGLPFTITRTQGDRLLELDGRPALEALAEFVGKDQLSAPIRALPWLAAELWTDEDRPHRHLSRTIRDVDPASGSVRVGPEIRPQMRLRMLLRDRERLLAAPARLAERLSGEPARLMIFQTCAIGRAGLVLGDDRLELAAELQRVAAGVPWLAVNGYGVFAPVEGQTELCNHAMGLTVLR